VRIGFDAQLRRERCTRCGGDRVFVDGQSLRMQRQKRGTSLRRLGAVLKLSAPYLCDIELNRRPCSLDLAKRYFDGLSRS